MTQLSLFADLPGFANSAAPVAIIPPSQNTANAASQIEAVANQDAAGEQDTLLKLAGLIRQGRMEMEAHARLRSRPIQSIGDLAQSVLLRHDLVAHRRAISRLERTAKPSDDAIAANDLARTTGAITDTRPASDTHATRATPIVVSDTRNPVHVAS